MIALYQVIVPSLNVYPFPYALGEHRTSEALFTLAEGVLIEVYEDFKVQHPRCGFIWRKLISGEGWVPQMHTFTNTAYLLWYKGVDNSA